MYEKEQLAFNFWYCAVSSEKYNIYIFASLLSVFLMLQNHFLKACDKVFLIKSEKQSSRHTAIHVVDITFLLNKLKSTTLGLDLL